MHGLDVHGVVYHHTSHLFFLPLEHWTEYWVLWNLQASGGRALQAGGVLSRGKYARPGGAGIADWILNHGRPPLLSSSSSAVAPARCNQSDGHGHLRAPAPVLMLLVSCKLVPIAHHTLVLSIHRLCASLLAAYLL